MVKNLGVYIELNFPEQSLFYNFWYILNSCKITNWFARSTLYAVDGLKMYVCSDNLPSDRGHNFYLPDKLQFAWCTMIFQFHQNTPHYASCLDDLGYCNIRAISYHEYLKNYNKNPFHLCDLAISIRIRYIQRSANISNIMFILWCR